VNPRVDNLLVRVATAADIPAMQRIRLAVAENRLSDPARITQAHYHAHLGPLGRGWVAEDATGVCGFACGRTTDGNVWALFVDPAHEGRGAGTALHDAMVHWLSAQGVARLWLTTGRGTRAEGFYLRRGWRVEGGDAGEVRLVLDAVARGVGGA
jgi:GNAT superfamily N-acetyltransferase